MRPSGLLKEISAHSLTVGGYDATHTRFIDQGAAGNNIHFTRSTGTTPTFATRGGHACVDFDGSWTARLLYTSATWTWILPLRMHMLAPDDQYILQSIKSPVAVNDHLNQTYDIPTRVTKTALEVYVGNVVYHQYVTDSVNASKTISADTWTVVTIQNDPETNTRAIQIDNGTPVSFNVDAFFEVELARAWIIGSPGVFTGGSYCSAAASYFIADACIRRQPSALATLVSGLLSDLA